MITIKAINFDPCNIKSHLVNLVPISRRRFSFIVKHDFVYRLIAVKICGNFLETVVMTFHIIGQFKD